MRDIILAVCSSLLLVLSFPAFDLGFFAWFSLVPLLMSLKGKPLTVSFGFSFLTGILFFMGVFYWINTVKGFSLLNFLVLGIYMGSYFGVFGLLFNWISRNTELTPVLTAPVLWVTMEYLRSNAGFMALPWALLGHSQYLNLSIIQIASFAGVYGVSYLIVMVNTILCELSVYLLRRNQSHDDGKLLPRYTRSIGFIGILLLSGSILYGFHILSQNEEENFIAVAVVQGNIPQHRKWDPDFMRQNLETHITLSKEASATSSPSLIVWPESSIPETFTKNIYLMQKISLLAKELKTYLLIGTGHRPKFGSREFREKHYFNSAFLLSPDGGMVNRYDKIQLLPFAEYLPYKGILPWPEHFESITDKLIPGKEETLFQIEGKSFGVLICWENIFPALFRRFVEKGAHFMVNITNEAWFGETAAPYQFLSMSVYRAVENHISIARSANTGISCFIDPHGRITGIVRDSQGNSTFTEGSLTASLPVSRTKTFYTRYGDIFVYLNIAVLVMLMMSALLRSKTKTKESVIS
jgi:apolipoprotein N-acyltransferase